MQQYGCVIGNLNILRLLTFVMECESIMPEI